MVIERHLMTWTCKVLRLFVWQYFLALSLGCLVTAALAPAVPLIVLYDLIWQVPAPTSTVSAFASAGSLSLLVLAGVSGKASWIAWRERKSASVVEGRVWLFAASVLNGAACMVLAFVCRDLKTTAIFFTAGCYLGLIVVRAFSSHPHAAPASR